MINNLINSILTMKVDVYKQFDTQDEDSGSIKKEWMFDRTLLCHAKGIISNSASATSNDKQIFDNKYKNYQVIQIRTIERITPREKMTNIRDAEGNVIWTEIDFPNNTPTVFEMVGVTPMTDPFGKVIGFNSTLKRSESQIIGI
jgi:hypothetical protein